MTAVEQRDALDTELRDLKDAVRAWRNHLVDFAARCRTEVIRIDNDVAAMDTWTAAQDEQSDGLERPPGEEDRTSAETDGQPGGKRNSLPLSQFTEAVEAAGLAVEPMRDSWAIRCGRNRIVYCQPLCNGRISYREFGKSDEHEGTVFDAIELAGPPVKGDS